MQLSIIIVNYNVKHFLEQCLLSVLRASQGLAIEIIVVDNNSQDGSVERVQEKFGNKVICIANKDNPGFSKANNQGIAIAKGKYVLLLNPDTLVEEDTFWVCLDFMDKHPDVGGLGVKMIDGTGKFLPESKRALPTPWVSFYKIFGFSALFPNSPRFAKYHLTYLDKDKNHEIEILSGAFMLMRKETLEKVGYLDEDFFMYGEDVDLSYRIILGGYKNYYLSDTQIIHYKGESTKKGSLNYVKVFYQAMLIFAHKHFNGSYQKAFIIMIRLAVYLRAIGAVLFRFAKKYGFQILESALFYGAIYLTKEYWEKNIKYIEGGNYPITFDTIAAPIYTAVFVTFLSLAGAYKKPFRIRPLLIATFSAFIAIATVTFVLPKINFSRAIVGLSSIFSFLIAILTRGILNYREKKNFFFTEITKKRLLIIGNQENIPRILHFLQEESDYQIVGFVTENGGSFKINALETIGKLSQLAEIIRIMDVQELVFCNKSLSSSTIISEINHLQNAGVAFRIVPPDADFMIGSQFIYTARQHRSIKTNLSLPKYQKQKQNFDKTLSAFLLLIYPISFFLYKSPLKAVKSLAQILKGNIHFVGYITQHLQPYPPIKSGVFTMLNRATHPVQNLNPDSLDMFYAKSYAWEIDLEIVLKNLRSLGDDIA